MDFDVILIPPLCTIWIQLQERTTRLVRRQLIRDAASFTIRDKELKLSLSSNNFDSPSLQCSDPRANNKTIDKRGGEVDDKRHTT